MDVLAVSAAAASFEYGMLHDICTSRYMYQETFGRWHAIDLFFGLAYLSRRAISEYPAADIAAAGQSISGQQLSAAEAQQLLRELHEVRRYMLYCQGLRHHRPEQQKKHWHDLVDLGKQLTQLLQQQTAGMLQQHGRSRAWTASIYREPEGILQGWSLTTLLTCSFCPSFQVLYSCLHSTTVMDTWICVILLCR